MNILIVEDDIQSADFLEKILSKQQYDVSIARGYGEAKEELEKHVFVLVLLDWQLGDGDGYELLKEFRAKGMQTPVIMLTSQNDTEAKAAILDAGADDYITKPYSHVELLARIRAVLRREATHKSAMLQIGCLTLDESKHKILLEGMPLELTITEYNLLKFLMLNKNVVLSRFQINEHLMKDFASLGNSNLVDVHIKNIRKKLGNCKIIETVRGIGYTICDKGANNA